MKKNLIIINIIIILLISFCESKETKKDDNENTNTIQTTIDTNNTTTLTNSSNLENTISTNTNNSSDEESPNALSAEPGTPNIEATAGTNAIAFKFVKGEIDKSEFEDQMREKLKDYYEPYVVNIIMEVVYNNIRKLKNEITEEKQKENTYSIFSRLSIKQLKDVYGHGAEYFAINIFDNCYSSGKCSGDKSDKCIYILSNKHTKYKIEFTFNVKYNIWKKSSDEFETITHKDKLTIEPNKIIKYTIKPEGDCILSSSISLEVENAKFID